MSTQTGHPERALDHLIPIAHRISDAINYGRAREAGDGQARVDGVAG